MYRVILSTHEGFKEELIKAEWVRVDGGALFFFCDKQATKLMRIINGGYWVSWEAMSESYAIPVQQKVSNAVQKPSAEKNDVCQESRASQGVREENKKQKASAKNSKVEEKVDQLQEAVERSFGE